MFAPLAAALDLPPPVPWGLRPALALGEAHRQTKGDDYMTIAQHCSVKVHTKGDAYGLYPHTCQKPVAVTREGIAYCTIHDPVKREARYIAKCKYQYDGRHDCGKPAVTTEYSSGRCALHTREALDAKYRLEAAAPELLHALELALETWYAKRGNPAAAEPAWVTIARAAVTKADPSSREGRSA